MADQTLSDFCDSTDILPKTCRICGEEYPPDGFHRDRRGRDGRATRCKKCASANAKDWYHQNIGDDDFRERRRAQGDIANKKWRENNPGWFPAYMAQYRRENADAIREQDRRWREANRERKAEKDRRRRARLLDAYVESIEMNDVWDRDGGTCQLCHEPVDPDLPWPHPMRATLDHVIPLARGGMHERANVQLAHMRCNSVKGDRLIG